ncbi:hypothetical protein E2C01_080500 [Portunus trituberculatus]|uniref:Uncharacterized protein n=1 Tax=Portunus trituberculatus TaxID=210409 RepID=A0A5B7ITM7_PORTR|nr:hypothetical protein [Portunus trituberculatus]
MPQQCCCLLLSLTFHQKLQMRVELTPNCITLRRDF